MIDDSALDPALYGTRSRSRLGKRTRDEIKDEGSDDSIESPHMVKKPALKTYGKTGRGGGRPPTTGAKAGKLAAKELLKADKKKQKAQDAEAEAEIKSLKVRKALSLAKYSAHDLTMEELVKAIRTGADTILHCAQKSGNVHGVFQRNFNDDTALILAAVETIAERSSNEEIRRLTDENNRLKVELTEVRKELAELKAQQRRDETPASAALSMPIPSTNPFSDREKLERDIMARCGAMINAQIQGIGDRLLPEKRRIPLAADRRREEVVNDPGVLPAGSLEPIGPTAPATNRTKAPKKTPTQKGTAELGPAAQLAATAAPAALASKAQVATINPCGPDPGRKSRARERPPTATRAPIPVQPRPLPPPLRTMEEGWTTVVKRGRRRGGNDGQQSTQNSAKRPQKPPAANNKRVAPKIRPPRSAAILLTLQPGAEEKGETYKTVIAKVKANIDIGSLGLGDGMRFLTAKTGCKVLQINGSTGRRQRSWQQKYRRSSRRMSLRCPSQQRQSTSACQDLTTPCLRKR